MLLQLLEILVHSLSHLVISIHMKRLDGLIIFIVMKVLFSSDMVLKVILLIIRMMAIQNILIRFYNQVLVNLIISVNLRHGLVGEDRKSTRLNSSHVAISYAVFCLKKKKCH